MNNKNKLFFYVLIIGMFAILNGSYLKINGNSNANIVLLTGLILKTTSIIGLIFNNLSKIKLFFK